MTVLMNYKRTVEDFKRCGSKSSTVYGLPYVSDCVGSNVDRWEMLQYNRYKMFCLSSYVRACLFQSSSNWSLQYFFNISLILFYFLYFFCIYLWTHHTRSLSCPELNLPVPCADGNCHSDYISCLRVSFFYLPFSKQNLVVFKCVIYFLKFSLTIRL